VSMAAALHAHRQSVIPDIPSNDREISLPLVKGIQQHSCGFGPALAPDCREINRGECGEANETRMAVCGWLVITHLKVLDRLLPLASKMSSLNHFEFRIFVQSTT
jgi:hypothetical protein